MAYAWGQNNMAGGGSLDLGLGPSLTAARYTTPQLMAGAVDFSSALCDWGEGGMCVGFDDNPYVFAENQSGSHFTGSTDFSTHPTPTFVAAIGETVTKIGSSRVNAYALTSSGNLWGSGQNSSGEFGIDSSTHFGGVLAHTNVVDFFNGIEHVIALLATGHVVVAGSNQFGQLGAGLVVSTAPHPWTDVTPATGTVVGIAGGWLQSFILMADGTIYGAGAGGSGQLGPSLGSTSTFGVTGFPTNVVEIATCGNHLSGPAGGVGTTFLRESDGTVWSCGNNTSGLLGTGSTTPSSTSTPVQVLLPTGITGVSLMRTVESVCMGLIGSDGNLYMWGDGSNGQMGNGTTTSTNATPTATTGLLGMEWVSGAQFGVYTGLLGATPPPSGHGWSFAAVIGD